MGKIRVYQVGSLNLRVSPLLQKEGDLLRSINVQTGMYGVKEKRPGYNTYLGTFNGGAVNTLFNWTQNDGTTFWNYASFNGTLAYSTQGTGAWTVCGGGTLTAGAPIGFAVQNNTLIIGDGTAFTRHTTDGTSFGSTTGAPIGHFFTTYLNRVYIGGTGNVLTYSVSNDATNWAVTGTSDSSSINIPGAGKMNQLFTANDRVIVSKNSQLMFRWDGFNLVQIPTFNGLTSPQSLVQMDNWFYLNRNGFHLFDGNKPQLISLPIQRQIYNDQDKGIIGTTFDNAQSGAHRYKYYTSVGTVTDDITMGTVANCIDVYDYPNDEWLNFTFAHRPSAWLSYKDATGSQQMIFASGSQCYTFGGTSVSDSGSAIDSVMEGVLHFGAPESDKEYKYIWAFFNPGAEAKVQVAMENTYTSSKKKWFDLGNCSDGVIKFPFPSGSRSKFLFWKVYDTSKDARYSFYGFTVELNILDKK